MIATNYSGLRENLKTYMDTVSDDYETVVVTRKENRTIIMIYESAYNNMLENMHLLGCRENYDWLMESKAQLEAGHVVQKELAKEIHE